MGCAGKLSLTETIIPEKNHPKERICHLLFVLMVQSVTSYLHHSLPEKIMRFISKRVSKKGLCYLLHGREGGRREQC